jgi:hypothetical protein
LAVVLAAGAALAPIAASQTATASSSTSPVAYVYVSRPTHIDGFAASSSGVLTPVPGSPLANTKVVKMSVTRKFLFGESGDGSTITTFSIASSGAIAKVSSADPQQYEPWGGCAYYPDIQVDFAGTTLYHQESSNCNMNASYLSFHIESNGDLEYLGNSGGYIDGASQGSTARLNMLSTDKFAYDSYCGEDESDLPVIDIYKRESTGLLTYIGQDNQMPDSGSGPGYCAGMLATDSAGHLAVAVQEIDSQDGDDGWITGPYYLASYTADSEGNPTTTSTSANMPETTVTNNLEVDAMSISPGNKYLAVGGPLGFQIFHFNGSSPITTYSGVLQPNEQFTKFGWDKANHLYALGGGYLYVYTVTSTSIKQAPGSPYSIPESSNVIVLDL